jgi:hypothetical protein
MSNPDPKAVSGPHATSGTTADTAAADEGLLPALANGAGYVLGVSYPVLAVSIGVRSIYQICCKPELAAKLPAWLSGVTAGVYGVLAFGFAVRRPWTWWVSVLGLSFELVAVVAIGTLSVLHPDQIGHTAWSNFGRDYGYFPFVQPLLGFLWLLWPATVRAYGVRLPWARPADANSA